MDYPKHLYEKIREEAAVSYLKHELKKIFPSVKDSEVDNLMSSKQLSTPRDFWNGVHGVGMGFKLHIGFIYLLTAENITWTKEKVKTKEMLFGIDRELTNKYTAKTPLEIWEKNPIFVVEKDKGLTVYDGHNRLEKFLSNDIETIEAYVGRYTTEIKKPTNYWLPTSIIMDNLFYIYQSIENNNEKLFESQIETLKFMLSFSKCGMLEFEERALTSKEPARSKILAAVLTQKADGHE